jgi:bacterial/archaeal transporter family-2 protein
VADKAPALLLMIAAGGFIALQAPINGMLGRTVGTFAAASVSFAIGTAALVLITALAGGGFGELGQARGLPWYYLTGGILGAIYVTSALFTVRTLGAGGVTAATITGQLTAAVVVDRLGALGLEQRPLSAARLVGVALLAVGTYLVVRE